MYCIYDDILFIQSIRYKKKGFLIPICSNDKLKFACELLLLENPTLLFYSVPFHGFLRLKNFYPFLTYEIEENDYDYIYLKEDLLQLKGKKYATQRNHLHQFQKKYPYVYEPVSLHNQQEILDFLNSYPIKADIERYEIEKMKQLIRHYPLNGGIIKVNQQVIAFTIAANTSQDTLSIHFEKAKRNYMGIYPLLQQEFLLRQKNIRYINREEDMGICNLRYNKQSYHPHALLNKYTICIKKDNH